MSKRKSSSQRPQKSHRPSLNRAGNSTKEKMMAEEAEKEMKLFRSRDILATPEILSPFDTEAEEVKGRRASSSNEKKRKGANADKSRHTHAKENDNEYIGDYYDSIIDAAANDILSPTLTGGARGKQTAKPAAQKGGPHKGNAQKNGTQKSVSQKMTEPSPAPKASAIEKKAESTKKSVKSAAAVTSTVAPATTEPRINSKPRNTARLAPIPGAKLKVIPLGGLNEVGKNMTVIEYGDEMIVIDCGIGFPDEDEMPGVDLVIPDITYLANNSEKIKGILLTHGHEDHIGAIPYILQQINPPIYGTRLALGIIENKLTEHTLPHKADLRCVKAGDTVRLGSSFSVEFIRVNHSIADACALAISTPLGVILHTGDFKLDLTPIEGEMMDIPRLGQLGNEGVLLLMCESTNAERPGYTPSEKKVGQSLEMIFTVHQDKRIVIATFSSNVHRVQQIIDISARHGRKVAVTGRSMLNIVRAATELGYMTVPDGVLIDIADIKRYKPEELTLVTTGSQGEPMSALYRMAFGDHNQVTLGLSDLVVLSASAIPGNEKLVNRIINELKKMGVQVINDASVEVHVSGHACQEELKLMQGLTKPRYFLPVHGEFKHMAANRDLAISMGVEPRNAFISEIGKILEIDEKGARFGGTVPSGVVLIDGYGIGDVGNIVLRDRKHLSQDGLIVVVASVAEHSGMILSGPDIVSRGFVYVRESEELMDEIRQIAAEAISDCLDRSGCDWYEIKNRVKEDITKFLYGKTKRKPMILPIIMEV